MKSIFILFELVLTCFICAAQKGKTGEITAAPQSNNFEKIEMDYNSRGDAQFIAKLRPLNRIAGARPPYWTYFWEFGDGTYSDVISEKVIHSYKENRNYQVRLTATNNYDHGNATTIIQQFNIRGNASPNLMVPAASAPALQLKFNRDPKPEENLVTYIGYRNKKNAAFSGSIILFYNDRRFLKKTFNQEDQRLYHDEKNTSLEQVLKQMAVPQVTTLKNKYLDNVSFRFNNLSRNEERFIFLTMMGLKEMSRYIDEFISMTALMIPDDRSIPTEISEMTYKIVSSHDPNQMELSQTPINYRFMKKNKELDYKVLFQNVGEGPARKISIGIALPKQLNTATIQIKEISPPMVSCDSITYNKQSCIDTVMTADSIHVIFNNIYLPGIEQNLVKKEDSTKGFVKYSLRFKKMPKKKPFSSRASIKFDDNEPLYTNHATARFVKGISPGIVAGYTIALSNGDHSAKGPLQIGFVLSPYAPSRLYLQAELYAGISQQEKSIDRVESSISYGQNFVPQSYQVRTAEREITHTMKRNIIQLVPLHLRKNVNDWIGIGAGVMGQIAVSEETSIDDNLHLTGTITGSNTAKTFDILVPDSKNQTGGTETKNWTDTNIAAFAEIQVGRVRTGPSLGLRYYRQLRGNIPNQFFVYAGFKL